MAGDASLTVLRQAIYSRSDGIVDWRACVDPHAEDELLALSAPAKPAKRARGAAAKAAVQDAKRAAASRRNGVKRASASGQNGHKPATAPVR